jgi:cupin fold WbuC family metalloprotein
MKIINDKILHKLSGEAAADNRLRKNLNLHSDYNEPSQRLLNAVEPGSYIRPHRHLRDPKPECFIGIRGRLVLFIFEDKGNIEQVVPFGPHEKNFGVDLPPGIWHTVVSMESGSVFFETKPGPYNPMHKKDFAPWAPEEGSSGADLYLNHLIRFI